MKSLAIIGASYLQLPLVVKARNMGLRTICFAWEDGAVCKEICDCFYPISIVDRDAILKVCQEEKIDAITTIASDVAVLTVNYVAEQMGLIGNPDQFSQLVTNKFLMRQCFLENQIPSPRFCLTDGEIPDEVRTFRFPLIVKPTDRSGSRGVEKVETIDTIQEAIRRACKESFQKKAVIEEFVGGREISVESISFNGHHFVLQITDKVTTGAPYFVELEHHQPSSLSEEIKTRVRTIVMNALDALHIKYGASHSELKISSDGDIRVIEIGARMGGDFIGSNLVELSTGYDYLKGVIDVAFGGFSEPFFTKNVFSGVFFLSEETKDLLPIIEKKDSIPIVVDAAVTDTTLRQIQCSGDRSGYLIYCSNQRITLEDLKHSVS